MKTAKHKLLQFNRSEKRMSGENIEESISTTGDIIFNESYIVIGDCLSESNITAMYNLSVYGNVKAEILNVNGDLLVSGNIVVKELNCNSELLCNGKVNAEKIAVNGKVIVDTVQCVEFRSYNDVIAKTTLDIDSEFSSSGQVIACEGIIGAGKYESETSIVKDYFEFDGEISGSVLELSSIESSKKQDVANKLENSGSIEISPIELERQLSNALKKKWSELSELSEDELLEMIEELASFDPQISSKSKMVNKMIDMGYMSHIDNLKDYLLIVYSKKFLPVELCQYDTIACVFDMLLPEAEKHIEHMEYKPSSIEDLAVSLRILDELPRESLIIPYETIADRIFSSIGLRYVTVKKAME